MNGFVVVFLSLVALGSALPSGIIGHGGAIVAGPSGIVTGLGPIGPVGVHGAGIIAASAHPGAIIAGPAAHGIVGVGVPGIIGHSGVIAGIHGASIIGPHIG